MGGLLAALIASSGRKVLGITRTGPPEPLTRTIRLQIGEDLLEARVTTNVSLNEPVTALFVCTKAPGLDDALGRVQPGAVGQSPMIPVLNGLEHIEKMRRRHPWSVVAATIGGVEAHKDNGMIVASTKAPTITLTSSIHDYPSVPEILTGAGIRIRTLDSEQEVLWDKLVRLSAIASVTAAHGVTVGEARSGDLRATLLACVSEAAAVATADGVPTNPGDVMDQIQTLPGALRTSLERDVSARRPSEVDSIAGSVVRKGESVGVACPTFTVLIQMIDKRTQP